MSSELAPRSRSTAPRRQPARAPRASDALADELRAKILSGALSPGTLLPNERELAERSGVGRSSVREALKALEIQGLIVTRPGRHGGSEVVRPTPESLAESIAVFIRGRKVLLPVLIELRQTIEPKCAELAAERRTEGEMTRLLELTGEMRAAIEETPRYLDANLAWHVQVAVASHNELLTGVLLAISHEVHAGTEVGGLEHPSLREATIRAHESIDEAIAARDGRLAGRRMERHIAAYASALFGPEDELGGQPASQGGDEPTAPRAK
ncbi:MAG: FadR/GntR family transcriptional regulator [Solirubrobacteraceae bacterium]